MTVVLDSWAIMRLLEGAEPAATQVQERIDAGDCVMSWINIGEVYYVVHRINGEAAANDTVADLESVLRAVAPDRHLVLAAAKLKAEHAMSYADCFAAATAITLDAVPGRVIPNCWSRAQRGALTRLAGPAV